MIPTPYYTQSKTTQFQLQQAYKYFHLISFFSQTSTRIHFPYVEYVGVLNDLKQRLTTDNTAHDDLRSPHIYSD
jgi:hypothetical protein